MKKFLIKVCLGSIAFAVFVAVGCPKIFSQYGSNAPVKEKKGLISRNGSGHYTRNVKSYKKTEKSKYSNVIYIGESTEGLLD